MTFEEDCQLLGVDIYFTEQELSAAHRRKAAQWHSDKLQDMAPELREYADGQLARINAAYDRLRVKAKSASGNLHEEFVALTAEITEKLMTSCVTQADVNALRAQWARLEPNLVGDQRLNYQNLFSTLEDVASRAVRGELDFQALREAKTPRQVLKEFSSFLRSLQGKWQRGPTAFSEEDLKELQEHWEELNEVFSSDQISEFRDGYNKMEATIRAALEYG